MKELLSSPAGIFIVILAVTGFLCLLLSVMVRFRSVRVVIMAMLFVSALGVAEDWYGEVYRTWLLPLQAIRSFIFPALGGVLLVAIVSNQQLLQGRKIPRQAVFLLLIGVYAGLLRLYHTGPREGALSMVFTILTVPSMALAISMYIKEREDYLRILRGMMLFSIAWTAAVAVQFALNRNLVVMGIGNRFIGLMGNPQHAAALLGPLCVFGLFLILNESKRKYKMFWIGVTSLNIVLLLWTGSRTGAGMLLIGSTAVLYSRIGSAVLMLPVFAAGAAGALYIASKLGIDLGAERLTSIEDTRSHAWMAMIENAMTNPVIGVGPSDVGASENSYLLGFASFGFVMFLLMIVFTIVSIAMMASLFRARKYMSAEWKSLVDLVIGYNALYFAGAMFEGYMMGRVAPNLVFILIFAGIGSRLLQQHATGETHSLYEETLWNQCPSCGTLLDDAAIASRECPACQQQFQDDLPESDDGFAVV